MGEVIDFKKKKDEKKFGKLIESYKKPALSFESLEKYLVAKNLNNAVHYKECYHKGMQLKEPGISREESDKIFDSVANHFINRMDFKKTKERKYGHLKLVGDGEGSGRTD